MALSKMRYKGFTLPYNPETSTFTCDRSYIRHKYPELAGSELEDFGPNAVSISCEGEFFGNDAYGNWNELWKVFKESGVGNVSHPIFTDITRGLMVSLKASLEPRPDYIKYTFEIIADNDIPINECLGKYVITTSAPASGSGSSTPAQTNSLVHTVVKGECLSVICYNYAKKYGVKISWRDVAKANNMANPNLIYPGDKITISW